MKTTPVFLSVLFVLSASGDLLAQGRPGGRPGGGGGGGGGGMSRPSPGGNGGGGMSRPTPSRPDRPSPGSGGGMNRPTPSRPDNSSPRPSPSPRPDTRPSPSPRPDTRPSPFPRPDTRPAPDTRPSPRPDTRPSPRPDTRPSPRPDTRPSPRPDTRPSPRPDTRPSPRPDNRPGQGHRPGPVINGPRPHDAGGRYRPPGHQQRPGHVILRRDSRHVPRPVSHVGNRYRSPREYYTTINHRFIFRRWIQEPVIFTYSNGYWDIGGYPYYVYQGYRYRYDPVDYCQYQLVDSETYYTVTNYAVQACSVAYDACAIDRDSLNNSVGAERYFCAEAVDEDLQSSEEQTEQEYDPTPIEMSEERIATIEAFLSGKTFMDVYNDSNVGNCAIYRIGGSLSSGNQFGCKYIVKVGQDVFPAADQSVCSQDAQAAAIGCNFGDEKTNTGCILQQAIEAGYCL